MSVPIDADQIIADLQELRRGEGLSLSRIQSSEALSALRLIDGTEPGDTSPTAQAQSVAAAIHDFLSERTQERIHRAAALALNLDVAGQWSGEITVAFPNSNARIRRDRVADQEGVNNNGGRPMLDWENEAFALLAADLLSRHEPRVDSETASAPGSSTGGTSALAPTATHSRPPAAIEKTGPSANPSPSWLMALGVAAALVFAVWIGTQIGSDGDAERVATTDATTRWPLLGSSCCSRGRADHGHRTDRDHCSDGDHPT